MSTTTTASAGKEPPEPTESAPPILAATAGSDAGSDASSGSGFGEAQTPDPKRWWALATIALAQLMIAVDATIVNIALPSAQRSLGLSDSGRQWVITAFALGFGGLLLVGGKLSDLIGRRRSLLIGLAGFAAASALGGAAVDPAMLLASRALQGAFGALLTPSALALLSVTFPTPTERAKAFAIYGTIMGSGGAIGVTSGGLLTDYLGWRWCLYVNVAVAVVAGTGVCLTVARVPPQPAVPVDVPGAVLATSGLVGVVFGLSRPASDGWAAPVTLGPLVGGLALLALFLLVQSRSAVALLPLRILRARTRGASYLAVASLGFSIFAAFLFLSFYLQDSLGYSPVRTGLAFLPYPATIMVSVRVVRRAVVRAPVRALLCPGLLAIAAGLVLLSTLGTDSGYWTGIVPVFVLLGLGTGLVMVPGNSAATLNAGPDTGVAGAMFMTSQQIGASLGTALLGTVALSTADHFRDSHAGGTGASAAGLTATADLARQAAVHGYGTASQLAALLSALAAVAVFAVAGRRPAPRPPDLA